MRSVCCESFVFPQKQKLGGGPRCVPSSKAILLWLHVTVFTQAGKGTEVVPYWRVRAVRRALCGALVAVGRSAVCRPHLVSLPVLRRLQSASRGLFNQGAFHSSWFRGFCSLDFVLSPQLLCTAESIEHNACPFVVTGRYISLSCHTGLGLTFLKSIKLKVHPQNLCCL